MSKNFRRRMLFLFNGISMKEQVAYEAGEKAGKQEGIREERERCAVVVDSLYRGPGMDGGETAEFDKHPGNEIRKGIDK